MNKILLITILLASLIACDKYIEDDISNEQLVLISPANDITTHETTISFWWEEIDEATKYSLQVVTPSFDSAIRLLVDTTMLVTQYEYEFSPATYECRVRAENSGSETEYVYRTFTIDSSMFLNNKKVQLTLPLDNSYVTSNNIIFKWDPLRNTDIYQFSLKKESSSGENVIEPFGTVVAGVDLSTKYSQVIEEGKYVWRVQAENALSATGITEFTFTVDRTAPDMPTLVDPAAKDSVTQQSSGVTLAWQQGQDNLDIGLDSVFLYRSTDSLATTLELMKRGVSSDETFSTGKLETKHWYYWTIVTYDKAGNATDSNNSGRSFYIKE